MIVVVLLPKQADSEVEAAKPLEFVIREGFGN